jgi:hypothetical protein
MATPSRIIPRLEAPVTIVYLDGRAEGVVQHVEADLRGLRVLTEEGETLHFELSRVTGHFMSGGQSGARLIFREPRDEADDEDVSPESS